MGLIDQLVDRLFVYTQLQLHSTRPVAPMYLTTEVDRHRRPRRPLLLEVQMIRMLKCNVKIVFSHHQNLVTTSRSDIPQEKIRGTELYDQAISPHDEIW
jgi:hypothetical protein